MSQRVSRELYEAIADAQAAAQKAHNLAYAQSASYWLRIALGRAQSILITWQVRLATRQPSLTRTGGYQGSGDPGRPTELMAPQTRPVDRRELG